MIGDSLDFYPDQLVVPSISLGLHGACDCLCNVKLVIHIYEIQICSSNCNDNEDSAYVCGTEYYALTYFLSAARARAHSQIFERRSRSRSYFAN